MHLDARETITKGLLGSISGLLTILISNSDAIRVLFALAGGFFGIVVSLLSGYSLWLGIQQQRRERNRKR